MKTTIARCIFSTFALIAIITASATFAANPRLKEVRKIHVGYLSSIGHKRGHLVPVAPGSAGEVKKRITAALVSSGRFSVVSKESEADATLEGDAGYIHSEKDGKKFTTGFADLKLEDRKTHEVLWTFEYKPQPGAGGSAAQRVADQAVQRLLEEAK